MPKYHNCDTIPAPVFFKILENKDYQLLKPKPKEKDLNKVFEAIYDEFFIKSDNGEAKRYLELRTEITLLNYKLATLKQTLFFYLYNRTTKKMRYDFIEALKKGYGIVVDKDAPFISEVKRILEIDAGYIENDISIMEMEYKDLTKKSTDKAFNYYSRIAKLGNAFKRDINVNIPLSLYIEFEKEHEILSIEYQKSKKP